MKHLILIFITAFIFIKCSYESILPKKTQELIPANANKVVLLSELPADSLFDFVVDFLTNNNFRIVKNDKEFGYVYTDGKYIDKGASLRLNFKIIQKDNFSELKSSGEWIPEINPAESLQQTWKSASKGEFNLSDYAYDNMVLLLQKIPNKEIRFIKE